MNNSQQNPNKTLFKILALAFIFLPSTCFAYEPIMSVAVLYSGSAILGTFILNSAIGLIIAVVIKGIVFYWKSDFKSIRTILFIIIAFIYSTFIGWLLSMTLITFKFIVLVFPLLLIPANNMQNYKIFKRFGIIPNVVVLFFLTVGSAFIFNAADKVHESSLLGYWLLKIICSTIAVSLSYFISVVCEDGLISYLYEKKYKTKKSFLKPVIWANAAVFIVVMGIGAALALPKRFASPNSLIGAIKLLVSYFSLG
ncbi:hypothetical protein HZA73_08130 [candidate division TA06 bacterium]|nr:hypothetical protein [candidate division TA06 bacterium]